MTDTYNINIYLPGSPKSIEVKLDRLIEKVEHMSGEMDVLTAEVTRSTSVDESAITLLNSLSAQLASIANDPAAVLALSAELKSNSDNLAAAITANTPNKSNIMTPAPPEPPVV